MEDFANIKEAAPNVFKLLSGQLEATIQNRLRASGFISRASTQQSFFSAGDKGNEEEGHGDQVMRQPSGGSYFRKSTTSQFKQDLEEKLASCSGSPRARLTILIQNLKGSTARDRPERSSPWKSVSNEYSLGLATPATLAEPPKDYIENSKFEQPGILKNLESARTSALMRRAAAPLKASLSRAASKPKVLEQKLGAQIIPRRVIPSPLEIVKPPSQKSRLMNESSLLDSSKIEDTYSGTVLSKQQFSTLQEPRPAIVLKPLRLPQKSQVQKSKNLESLTAALKKIKEDTELIKKESRNLQRTYYSSENEEGQASSLKVARDHLRSDLRGQQENEYEDLPKLSTVGRTSSVLRPKKSVSVFRTRNEPHQAAEGHTSLKTLPSHQSSRLGAIPLITSSGRPSQVTTSGKSASQFRPPLDEDSKRPPSRVRIASKGRKLIKNAPRSTSLLTRREEDGQVGQFEARALPSVSYYE